MAERFNAAVLKTVDGENSSGGSKPLFLRQISIIIFSDLRRISWSVRDCRTADSVASVRRNRCA